MKVREDKKGTIADIRTEKTARIITRIILSTLFVESRTIRYFVERLDTKMFI